MFCAPDVLRYCSSVLLAAVCEAGTHLPLPARAMAILKVTGTDGALDETQDPLTAQPVPPCRLRLAVTRPRKPSRQVMLQLPPKGMFCRAGFIQAHQ
jgi:hypothetical protein